MVLLPLNWRAKAISNDRANLVCFLLIKSINYTSILVVEGVYRFEVIRRNRAQ